MTTTISRRDFTTAVLAGVGGVALSSLVHMHLKDFAGGEHFVGYCPLGQGKVDLKAILDMVEGANPNANVMVELDGSPNMPYTPLETAQMSRTYLEKLGYKFRTS